MISLPLNIFSGGATAPPNATYGHGHIVGMMNFVILIKKMTEKIFYTTC
jgi:hypothetical protein